MGSLWGSKNNDEEERPLSRDAEPSFRQEAAPPHEADERTRLLQQNRDGYLSPDDPAVSIHSFLCKVEGFSTCAGLAVQSLECPISQIFHRPLLGYILPLVGTTSSLNLRQPARNALAWIRILRFLLHQFDSWKSSDCPVVLLHAIKGCSSGMSRPICSTTSRYDSDCLSTKIEA